MANKVFLIGRLTRDPELRQTQSGTSVCTFSIAVNRNYTNANGEREADFINITVWRSTAENCARYLTKGRRVAVVGSLQSRSYEDKDGKKRTVLEVVGEDVEFLSDKSEKQGESAPAPKSAKADLQPVDDMDQLPF